MLVDWSVCDAPADCGCLALSPYDPARDHGVSTTASGAGAGGAVVKTTGSSVREIADAAPALANVRDLDCGNESDGKGHVSEKSGHWKVSGPVLEANGNEQESDIADAGIREMRTFAHEKDWKTTDGSTSAAPAIIPRSIIRSGFVSNSTSAPPSTPTTPPTATVGPFGPLAVAHLVESHPAIALSQRTSIAFFCAAHLFFFLFHEAMGNARWGILCFD